MIGFPDLTCTMNRRRRELRLVDRWRASQAARLNEMIERPTPRVRHFELHRIDRVMASAQAGCLRADRDAAEVC